MNDESKEATVARRASRAQPPSLPGPAPILSGTPDRVPDGQVLDGGVAEHDTLNYKRRGCTLCDLDGVNYDEFQSGTEFKAHLRTKHSGRVDNLRDRIPCVTHCTWVCSVCGQESFYPVREPGVHGGPTQRSFDRRFGFSTCLPSRYPDHKRVAGRIDGSRGPVVHYHEGLTFSEQPEQTDPGLARFLNVAEPKKRAVKAKSAAGDSQAVREAGNRAPRRVVQEQRGRMVRAGAGVDS